MATIEYDEILLNFSSKVDAKGLRSAVNSLEKLKDINGFSGLKQASEDLKGFLNALDGITNKRMRTITNLATSLKGLGNVSKAMKATKTLAENSNPLNDTTMGEAQPSLSLADMMKNFEVNITWKDILSNAFDEVKEKGVQAFETVKETMSPINSIIKDIGRGLKKLGSSLVSPFKSMFSGLDGLLGKFGSLVRYRLMRAIISGITEGIKEGFSNLEAWDRRTGMTGFAEAMDRARESLLVLKNSLAVVGAPFLEGLISMLQQVAQWAMAGANALSRFFAILGDKGNYRVVKWAEYTANSVKATTGAVKNAGKEFEKQLMKFDEINNITDKKGSGGSSGYGNSGYFNYDDMFDTENVGELSDSEKKLKAIVDRLKEIGERLKPLWEAIQRIVAKFKEWHDTLAPVVWDGALSIFEGLADTLSILGDTVATLVEDFDKLVEAFVGWDNVAKILEGAFAGIKGIIFLADLVLMTFNADLEKLGYRIEYAGKALDLWGQLLGGKIPFSKFISDMKDAREEMRTGIQKTTEDLYKDMEELFDRTYKLKTDSSALDGIQKKADIAMGGVKTSIETKAVEPTNTFGTALDGIFNKKWALHFDKKPIDDAKSSADGLKSSLDKVQGTYRVTINTTENVTRYITEQNTNPYSGLSAYERRKLGLTSRASGGFVDRGDLFIANEAGAEMVGSIGGRTAVANNDQIVSAVSAGVAQAVSSVLGGQSTNVNVTLEGDAKGIFKVVQKEGRAYSARTGQPALA